MSRKRQVLSAALSGQRRVFVHELEAAVWRVEGIHLVIRRPGTDLLLLPPNTGAAYLPMKGQKRVRPAKAGTDEASFHRRLQTIANRVSNLIPDCHFTLHDPAHPKGWPGHAEVYPKRPAETDEAYVAASPMRAHGLQ